MLRIYETLLSQFGDTRELTTMEQIAGALIRKGLILDQMGHA
jgi:hypothetical protein